MEDRITLTLLLGAKLQFNSLSLCTHEGLSKGKVDISMKRVCNYYTVYRQVFWPHPK